MAEKTTSPQGRTPEKGKKTKGFAFIMQQAGREAHNMLKTMGRGKRTSMNQLYSS